MSVVISSSLTLGESVSGGGVINANNPIIGYQNLVTSTNISATTADADFPAANLANPSTSLRWLGEIGSPEADEYITIEVNTAELIDYVGIARHNFGTAQIPVSIEGLVDPDASPLVWDEIVQDSIPANDQPLILRFTPAAYASVRIRLQPGSAAPTAAVVYVGKLLVLQRRIYVGHTPINYGRASKVINAKSENGSFLGRIVLNESTTSKVDLQNLTPDWYRTYFDPFVTAAREKPFFWAWRPSDYPAECGYAWLTNDPKPSNQLANGMMQVSFDMGGIYT
jgi:hypothetical protein